MHRNRSRIDWQFLILSNMYMYGRHIWNRPWVTSKSLGKAKCNLTIHGIENTKKSYINRDIQLVLSELIQLFDQGLQRINFCKIFLMAHYVVPSFFYLRLIKAYPKLLYELNIYLLQADRVNACWWCQCWVLNGNAFPVRFLIGMDDQKMKQVVENAFLIFRNGHFSLGRGFDSVKLMGSMRQETRKSSRGGTNGYKKKLFDVNYGAHDLRLC